MADINEAYLHLVANLAELEAELAEMKKEEKEEKEG